MSEHHMEYYAQHAYCPVCGQHRDKMEQTAMAVFVSSAGEFLDNNRVWCADCGWRGRIHDMIDRDPQGWSSEARRLSGAMGALRYEIGACFGVNRIVAWIGRRLGVAS